MKKRKIKNHVGYCRINFWFLGIIIYVRNIVHLIPFPMNGLYGFQHKKVKELSGDTTFAVAFVYFQKKLQNILERL